MLRAGRARKPGTRDGRLRVSRSRGAVRLRNDRDGRREMGAAVPVGVSSPGDGPIETGVDLKVGAMMADLTKQGCRALILDLRWCPGGWVIQGTNIAGMFLREGATIARMDYRNPQQASSSPILRVPAVGAKYPDLPLVLLVGSETTGGGELIAAALRA